MREGSKIVVEDTFALINGTYLTGCTTMWQGIHTTEHVKLTLIDCTIEMAEFGVKLADQTTFICRNVDFIDNFIGISVGSPFDDNNDFVKVAQEGEITGCQFYTVGYLPDPYPGHYYEEWPEPDGQVFYHRGFAAVFMKNSIGLTLGSWTAQDTQRNNVYDMRNGVIMLNSQSYISGTDFHDFEGQFPAGLRIALLRTNQVGIYSNNSVATIESNKITDLMVGVWGIQTSDIITRNEFYIYNTNGGFANTKGIHEEKPQNLSIIDNKIYNGFLGIWLQDGTRPFQIQSNYLERYVDRVNNEGIRLDAYHILGNPRGIINDNLLEFDNSISAVGISLNSITGIEVDDNNINFEASLLAGPDNVGIFAVEATSCIISKNVITADMAYNDPEADSSEINAGLVILNSKQNSLFCNTIENFNTNLYIIGTNNMTRLSSNIINDASFGFDLYGPSRLGIQDQTGNQWTGDYNKYGAFISGINVESTAEFSRFLVDAFDDGGIYKPDSIGPEEVENNEWFDHREGTAHTCFTESQNILAGSDLIKLVRETLDFTSFLDEMIWLSYADIYDMLLKHDSLLTYAPLDSFYDIQELEVLGNLMWARHNINLIPDEHIGDKLQLEETIHSLTDDIVHIDSILSSGPLDRLDWIGLRALKNDTLAENLKDWLYLLSVEDTGFFERCEDMLVFLNGITTGRDLEDYLKESLRVKIELLLGNTLSGSDSTLIFNFHDLCPWQGGYTLGIEAGLFAEITDSLPGHSIYPCVFPEPFIGKPINHPNLSHVEMLVFPNPASDQISIYSKMLIHEVIIHDLTSKSFFRYVPNGSSLMIDVNGFSPGIYILNISSGDKIHPFKIVINQ
jgi:hypothetical protein